MATLTVEQIVHLAPQLLSMPSRNVWSTYDEEADVLYLNFKKPSLADDSELTSDDVLVRYQQGEIAGITILNASKRLGDGAAS